MEHGNNCESQLRFPVPEEIKHFHIDIAHWHMVWLLICISLCCWRDKSFIH